MALFISVSVAKKHNTCWSIDIRINDDNIHFGNESVTPVETPAET